MVACSRIISNSRHSASGSTSPTIACRSITPPSSSRNTNAAIVVAENATFTSSSIPSVVDGTGSDDYKVHSSSSPYLHNATLVAPFAIPLDSCQKNVQNGTQPQQQQQQQQEALLHIEEIIFNILQEIIPTFLSFWHIDAPGQLLVCTLQGGLSNHLYTVQPRNHKEGVVSSLPLSSSSSDATGTSTSTTTKPTTSVPSSILVRIHEDAALLHDVVDTPHQHSSTTTTNYHYDLVNRCTENHISAVLSSKGMAPTYFGRFQNGRLEEFCENARPLKHYEMKEPFLCKEIARQLGKFHTLLSFEDLYDLDGNGNGNGNEIHNGSGDSSGGDIWTRVDEWLQVATEWYATTKKDDDDCDDISQAQITASLKELSQEWSWLKDELLERKHACTTTTTTTTSPPCPVQNLAKNFCRDIVFTHMDCQSLNILLTQPKCDNDDNNSLFQLQFIDFEYAGMNPRAADIGNTFCEFCDMNNLIPDYTAEYPCDSIQDMFLQSYIAANDPALDNTLKGMTQSDKDLFLSTMRQEIGKHSLISHLGWAVWSLIQNKQSSIDFDYIRYAEIRMDGYHMFKKIFWS